MPRTASASLTDRVRRDFSSQVRKRGADYFRRGKAADLHGDEFGVGALVRGNYGTYSVYCEYDPGDHSLDVGCTCPYYTGSYEPCKHIWAVLLTAEVRGFLDGPVEEPGQLTVIPSDPPKEADGADEGAVDAPDVDLATLKDELKTRIESDLPNGDLNALERMLAGRISDLVKGVTRTARKKPKTPAWRSQLDLIRSRMRSETPERTGSSLAGQQQILYIVDAHASLQWSTSGLVIEIAGRKRKKNGEWGKPQTRRIRPMEAEQLPDPADREIIALLLGAEGGSPYGYGYGGYDGSSSQYKPPPAMQATLMRAICRTERCLLRPPSERYMPLQEPTEPPLRWDEGPAWELYLDVQPDAEQRQYTITGSLRRGEQRMALSEPIMLTPGGVLLTDTHAAPFEDFGASAWIETLRREGELVVPAADREELMRALLDTPRLPRLDVAEELRYEEVRGEPKPRLRVRSPERNEGHHPSRLVGELSFEYEDEIVAASTPSPRIYREETRRLLLRDIEAERAAERTLRDLGFRDPPAYVYNYDTPLGVLELLPRFLPRVVNTLTEAGWRVEADGKVYRQPSGAFDIEVRSGVDWFELHGGADFGEQTAALPDLLKALRRGDNAVRLDDGTYGMLPEKWLNQYGRLAELGEAEGDHVRFRRTQVGVLDALLASQPEASCDESFRRLRDQLHGFEGVDPADPPDTFTGELRGYQREGLGWMRFLQGFDFGGCLADDMGLGKTVQVLALLESRRQRRTGRKQPKKDDPPPPSLAVVPRSLVHNWAQEAARFAPKLRVLAHHGPGRTRGHEHFNDYDLVITTYGTLRRDAADFAEQRFDYAVLDEAQAIKNHKTASAKAARLIRADYRLALTGTPIENRLSDLWSIFEFLNPGMLGTASVFQRGIGGGNGNGNGAKAGASGGGDEATRQVLARALRPFILRRTKEQVAGDLPEKTEQTLYCDLPRKQRRQYDELRDHYRRSLLSRVEEKGLNRSKMHVLEALLRLRQAACHPGLIDKSRAGEPSAKLDTLIPQLAEVVGEGHKALVFSQFTTLLRLVRDRLDSEKLVYEYLDGRTRKRGPRIERFQNDPDCGLFLISLKAGGLGLNLTAADYVFLLDPWWNPAVEAQAIDRTHRIGQTRRVFACRLIARDTVEEKVLELQNSKRDLADAIINADNNLLSRLSREDLQLLLS